MTIFTLIVLLGIVLYRVYRKLLERNEPSVSSFDTYRDPGDENDHFI